MAPNPYEAPKTDIAVGPGPQAPGAATVPTPLPPEVERKAFELFGQKRSRLTGISFAVSGVFCIGLMSVLTGMLVGFILGGALGGAIAKVFVRSQTGRLAGQVCAELGIPRWAFNPERYLF